MSFLRRLRDRGGRDDELASRLPAVVLGRPLDRMSFSVDAVDEASRWWYGGITEMLGVPPDRLTLALAKRPDDPRLVHAIRVRGCPSSTLQASLDFEAWMDRDLAGGDETVMLGGLRVRRGVAGAHAIETGPDGTSAVASDEVIDPMSVFYQLLRGDSWFNIFAGEDLAWAAAAAAAISGDAVMAARGVSVSLPEGWIGGALVGKGSAELAEQIERRLATADAGTRGPWAGVLGKLRPERLERPFLSGTRYVAYDLVPRPGANAPSRLEVHEYLAPYGSLDEELRLEGEAVGAVRSAETGSVEHPLGPAGRLTARVDTDDRPVLVQEWLIRPGPVAYRILFILAGETPETRLGEVARIARSLVVNPE